MKQFEFQNHVSCQSLCVSHTLLFRWDICMLCYKNQDIKKEIVNGIYFEKEIILWCKCKQIWKV